MSLLYKYIVKVYISFSTNLLFHSILSVFCPYRFISIISCFSCFSCFSSKTETNSPSSLSFLISYLAIMLLLELKGPEIK
nr:MAG TPA: hypothetical protein [Caudoviricetes sp.]